MKRYIFTLCILSLSCLIASAQQNNKSDWAKFYRYEEANTQVAESGVKLKAVIMGDSITDNWLRYHPDFFKNNNIAGRGISGQVTAHMLARFQADVVNNHPKYVVILAGTNDIALNNGYVTLDHILDNIESMCDIARSHKIKVVLCSVLPASEYKWRPEVKPAQDIKTLNAMIKDYAASHRNVEFLDFWSMLANAEGGLGLEYSPDGVHPNPETYNLLEDALLKLLK